MTNCNCDAPPLLDIGMMENSGPIFVNDFTGFCAADIRSTGTGTVPQTWQRGKMDIELVVVVVVVFVCFLFGFFYTV